MRAGISACKAFKRVFGGTATAVHVSTSKGSV